MGARSGIVVEADSHYSGIELLGGASKAQLEELGHFISLEIDAARKDPCALAEFCFTIESTGEPIVVPPHAELGIRHMLDHRLSVQKWPIETAKTTSIGWLICWLLGNDCTERVAVISESEDQAAKTVGWVKTQIEQNDALQLVFPNLRRNWDMPWTQTEISVERPIAIRHPSLTAYGLDTERIRGTRLTRLFFDDICSQKNSLTKDNRKKVIHLCEAQFLDRRDPRIGTATITNTPQHPEDAIAYFEKLGWASLTMELTGNILLGEGIADQRRRNGRPWDTSLLVRASRRATARGPYRLVKHGFDPKLSIPLWPKMFSPELIAEIRATTTPYVFNQTRLCKATSDELARCKLEWIERCKENAQKLGILSLLGEGVRDGEGNMLCAPYTGDNLIFGGIDLAISQGEASDDVCFFYFEQLPTGHRRVLLVDYGKYDLNECSERLLFYDTQLKVSCNRVENNAAQDLFRQHILLVIKYLSEQGKRFPNPPTIRPHTTTARKAHATEGVQAVFADFYNGLWIVPCDEDGRCAPNVQRWLDECHHFDLSKHTGDGLMASYFAREQAKEWGVLGGKGSGDGGVSVDLGSR